MSKVLIRHLTIEDASVSFRWRNDPEIWRYTGNKPDQFVTEEIERNWLAKKLNETNSSRFAIIVDDKYVGNIQITDIIKNYKGQYHIFIGDKSFWGKGIGMLATAQIIRFAKEKLNLKEIYLIVSPKHIAALNLYEKCGFIKVNDRIQMNLNLCCTKNPVISVFVITYNH
jgi:RimJ/RimL family protein N-acetyltransferase